MASIEVKYGIGDKVFLALPVAKKHTRPCPDCLGTKEWKVTSPGGEDYTFWCPRCSGVYQNRRELSLDYSQFVPEIRELTIGSIQVNTHDEEPNGYMCVETGVGSGYNYYESQLFLTAEEALVACQGLCDEKNNEPGSHTLQRYNDLLKVCDYQLCHVPKPKKTKKK